MKIEKKAPENKELRLEVKKIKASIRGGTVASRSVALDSGGY